MPSLSTLLPTLETRGLLRVTLERDKPVVRFKHALTREATYNTILQARRAELHRAAAQTLANLNPQPDLEMVLTIAEHWQRGNEDARALQTVLPHAQALNFTGRSISLTALLTRLERENLDETARRDLDITLADAYAARGEYGTARDLYQAILPAASEDARRARILHSVGVAAYHLNENDRAIEYQLASLELAGQLGDLHLQSRAYGGLGLAYWRLGNYSLAEENLKASFELGLQLGPSTELAHAEYNLAGISLDRGNYPDTIEYAGQATALYEKLGLDTQSALAYQLVGAGYYGLHDLQRAAAEYEHAIQQSRKFGDHLFVALGLGNLAEVYADWNQLDKAADSYAEAIQLLHQLKYDSLLVMNLAGLADVQVRRTADLAPGAADRQAALREAEANLDQALTIALRIRSLEGEGVSRHVLAKLLAAYGDLERAVESITLAVELFEKLGLTLQLERAYATRNSILVASESNT